MCIYRYINVLERSLVIAVARYYYDEMKGLRVYLCFSFLFCSFLPSVKIRYWKGCCVGTWEGVEATPPIFNYKCCYHKRPLRCFISNLPIVHLKEMSYMREFIFDFAKTSPLCWSLMPNLLQFTVQHAYTLFLLMALYGRRWTSRLAWDFVCNCVHKAGSEIN